MQRSAALDLTECRRILSFLRQNWSRRITESCFGVTRDNFLVSCLYKILSSYWELKIIWKSMMFLLHLVVQEMIKDWKMEMIKPSCALCIYIKAPWNNYAVGWKGFICISDTLHTREGAVIWCNKNTELLTVVWNLTSRSHSPTTCLINKPF